jgi:3-methyladenine DNA glycosylase AlkD
VPTAGRTEAGGPPKRSLDQQASVKHGVDAMVNSIDAVLEELESCGTEQSRKIYRRHGVGENQFGVSYANLGKLRKRIKVDHGLALALWASENHDARVLATMIADPRQTDEATLERWARDLDCYPLTDAFSDLAAKSAAARTLAERWIGSDEEWVGRAGWLVLARLAGSARDLSDAYFEGLLDRIEREIHARKNYVRDAMNSTLIAIGIRNERLEGKALAAATRIGTVEVDHGQTSCTTQDAAGYIRKTVERRRRTRPAPAGSIG